MPMADVPIITPPPHKRSTLGTGNGYLFSTGLLSSDGPCEIGLVGDMAREEEGDGALKFPIYTACMVQAEAAAHHVKNAAPKQPTRNKVSRQASKSPNPSSSVPTTPRGSLISPRGSKFRDTKQKRSSGGGGGGNANTGADAFARLHNEHFARMSRHEEKKHELVMQRIGEEETVLRECTFEPNMDRRSQVTPGSCTWERLYSTETQATIHAHRSKSDEPSPGPGYYAPPSLGQASNGATAPIPLLKQAQKGSEKSSQASSTGTSGSKGKSGYRGKAKGRGHSPRIRSSGERLKVEKVAAIPKIEKPRGEGLPKKPKDEKSTMITAKICDMSDLRETEKSVVADTSHDSPTAQQIPPVQHVKWDSMTLSSYDLADTPLLGPADGHTGGEVVRPFASGKCIDCGQALPSELPYCPATGNKHISNGGRCVVLKEGTVVPVRQDGGKLKSASGSHSCLSFDDTDQPTAVDMGSCVDTDDTSVRMCYSLAVKSVKASGIGKSTRELLARGADSLDSDGE